MSDQSLDMKCKKILSSSNCLRIFYFSFILIFVLFSYPTNAFGSEIPSFTVYYFHNQTGEENWKWLERGMADMLNRTFSQFDQIQCLSLSVIDQIPEADQFRGLSERKEHLRFHSLADLLGVDIIFTGNYDLNLQGEIQFSLVMYHSKTSELVQFRDIVSLPENLLQAKEDLARVILNEIGIVMDEKTESLLDKNISHSMSALMMYYQAKESQNLAIREYKGIDFPSKPLWVETIKYGEKAVEEDPNFAEAYYLLVEIYERTKWTIREIESLEKFIETAANNSNIQVGYQQLSESLYRLAYSRYSQGNITDAIEYLEDSITYDPNNVQARTYLMRIYYQIGKISEALRQAEKVKIIEPDNKEIDWFIRKSEQAAEYGKEAYENYENGYRAYVDQNWNEAIRLLGRSVQLNDNFKDAHYYLALSYYYAGNLESSIHHWEETIRLDPFDNNAKVYLNKSKEEKEFGRDVVWIFNKAYEYYIAGEYEEALSGFKNAINMNPDFEKARTFLMRTYYHLNRMDEYLEERKKIGESKTLTSDQADEYYQLAYEFYALGEYDVALEKLNEVLEIHPDYLEAVFLIAETYHELGDFKNAMTYYQKIVTDFKGSEYDDDALLGSGWCAYLLEDYQQSEKDLTLLVEQFSKSPFYQEGIYKLGRAYFAQGQYQKVIEMYEKLMGIDFLEYDITEIKYLLGQSYFWIEEYSKARDLLQEIMENNPDFDFFDDTQYFYCFSLFKEGRYQETLDILEELAAKEGSKVQKEALYLLGRSLLELKDYDRVIRINLSLLEKDTEDTVLERALFDLGLSYARKGECPEAIRYFNRVIEEYDQGELAKLSRLEIGQCYYDLEQYQNIMQILEGNDSKEALKLKIDAAIKLEAEDILVLLLQEMSEEYPDTLLGPEEYYSLAKSQFEKGEYQKAIDTFHKMGNLIQTEEMHDEVNYWQGLSFYRLEQYQEAKELFQKIDPLKGNEVSIRSLYMLAETCYKEEDYKQAMIHYQNFLNHYPSHSLAGHSQYNIGWSYLNSGDYENALSVFEMFIQKYPESEFLEESYFLLGKISFLTEDNLNSRNQMADFLNRYPDSQYREEALYINAQIDLEEQKWIDSIVNFEKLIDGYADSRYLPGALYGLCLSYFKEERYENAIKIGERYLHSFSSGSFKCDLLYITAISYEEIDNVLEARKKYDKIVSECPDSIYFDSAKKQLELIGTP